MRRFLHRGRGIAAGMGRHVAPLPSTMLQEIYGPTWAPWCARALPTGYDHVDAVHGKLRHAVVYDTRVWRVVHHDSRAHRGRVFQLVVLQPTRRRRGPRLGIVNVNFWHHGRFRDLVGMVSGLLPVHLPPMCLLLGGDFNLEGPKCFRLGTDRLYRPGCDVSTPSCGCVAGGKGSSTCCFVDPRADLPYGGVYKGPLDLIDGEKVPLGDHIYVGCGVSPVCRGKVHTIQRASDHLPVSVRLSLRSP